MTKDVRKEQLALLKFEQKLAALAAFVAASSATAASAADKINGEATMKAYEDIRGALVQLADVTAAAHQSLLASVAELGVRAFEVSGGTPKASASEVVRSILGIG
jgi:xanthine dehydrogenase molybdopterin-binding subunit B